MKKFKQTSNHLKQEANQNEIEGGLYGIYYSNKDTKLLLDLLAECSGIGPCLKLLCLLDKSLLENAKCNYMNTFLQDPDSEGCRDVIVEFNDSKAVKDIFCQIPKALCTYSLEISPPVESGSWRILKFDKEKVLTNESKKNGIESQKTDDVTENITLQSTDKMIFKKLKPGVNYKISISTQVSGTIVGRKNSTTVKFD